MVMVFFIGTSSEKNRVEAQVDGDVTPRIYREYNFIKMGFLFISDL